MNDFKVGDKVKIKSGGPDMIIQGIIGKNFNLEFKEIARGLQNGDFLCKWWWKDKYELDFFQKDSLIKVE